MSRFVLSCCRHQTSRHHVRFQQIHFKTNPYHPNIIQLVLFIPLTNMFPIHREAQYVRQFNEVWGVRKNLSKSELEPILRICKDRDAAGVETVITRYGVPLSKETLYRRGNRRFESTLEKIKVTTVSGISTHDSSLPEGMII